MENLEKYGVMALDSDELMKIGGGGNFLDGVTDGCDGTCDWDRYAKDFWYTFGWGIGKTFRDEAMS